MHKLPLLIILILGISLTPLSFSEEIPDWVRNTAGWWSERTISQNEFTNGLEFLINQGIIFIPPTEPGIPGPDKIIPDWVRNTAGWWSQSAIPDSEFINAMKYLIEIGLIEIDTFTPEISKVEEVISQTSELSGLPIHMVLDGYGHAAADGKFVLDIKIYDEEKFFATYGRQESPVNNVQVNISLYNQEDELIHTFTDLTKNGIVRYDVLAKETSQKGTLWKISNLYTVNVVATLDDQKEEQTYEFYGQASAYAYNSGDATTTGAAYDVSKAVFNQSVDVNPPATTPEGLIFSSDGSKMFISDNNGSQIEEFTLSTPWDISTATDSGSPLNITDSGGDIEDFAFNSDGTKIFLVDRSDDMIMEYTLSSAYDVSTATYAGDGERCDVSAKTGNPEDVALSKDGTRLFVLENDGTDSIFTYTLSSAYDVSTCTSPSQFNLPVANNADAFEFSADGDYLYIADPSNSADDTIYQYRLTTNWTLSTASQIATLTVGDGTDQSRGLAFGNEGTKLYVTGTSDTVFEYDLQP